MRLNPRSASARDRHAMVAGVKVVPVHKIQFSGRIKTSWTVYVDGHIICGHEMREDAEIRAEAWEAFDAVSRRMQSASYPVAPGCDGLAYTRHVTHPA